MLPPRWVIEDAARLNLDEFGVRFSHEWPRVETRFLKLEVWQTYRELEQNKSQAAFERGDVRTARELLRQEAEGDLPIYEEIARRGIEYARIRLVREPLTSYLSYELMAYEIRADMGENIEVVRVEPNLQLPNKNYFDFLLFDRRAALIHDYGDVGSQVGGWLVRDPGIIAFLETTAESLRREAMALSHYVATARGGDLTG